MMLDGARYTKCEAEENLSSVSTTRSPGIPLDRRLVVALDVPNIDDARAIVNQLGTSVRFYKIGYELVFGGGLNLVEVLQKEDKWVFLDMKLLDIGNTVKSAVANVARLGCKYLTIHAQSSKTLKAAIDGRGDSGLGLLAVTVLTDHTRDDLKEQDSLISDPSELTLRRVKLAFNAGFDGVIASPLDAKAIREATSANFVIKTPGVRPAGSDPHDQVRVMTPRQAIANGANYLVVGRPIIQARDPKRVAQEITADIEVALCEIDSLGKA
jgi:orotidine-5'-phosphate decarboxylase